MAESIRRASAVAVEDTDVLTVSTFEIDDVARPDDRYGRDAG